jgi:SAM-dependent methyltransferase
VNPLATVAHAIAQIPVIGTALFLITDTLILCLVTLLDPWLARILFFKIRRGQRGWRAELRTGLDFYRYVEYPRVVERLAGARPTRVLDIGSNYGLVWQWVAAHGAHVHATDIRDITLRDARAHLPDRDRERAHISLHDAQRLGFADESFDAVTAISTIEHIEDDRAVMAEVARVLQPGGVAIITMPVNPDYREVRDNASFPLIRHYALETLEQRLLADGTLQTVELQLWCIRDHFGAVPLWTFTRFSDVLRRFVYYRRLKPPHDLSRIAPNPLGHHIGILILRKRSEDNG